MKKDIQSLPKLSNDIVVLRDLCNSLVSIIALSDNDEQQLAMIRALRRAYVLQRDVDEGCQALPKLPGCRKTVAEAGYDTYREHQTHPDGNTKSSRAALKLLNNE